MRILEGKASTTQIAALLVALRMKGEASSELQGFASAMRQKANPVPHGISGEPIVDTCGTGGDGGTTFNISTVVAFVVAGTGLRVAKHGNRSLSSQCGSADVLEQFGVNIAMSPEMAAAAIREIGIGFLFAPAIHPAMKYAQPARAELKMRTAFNLLGPLTNPASASAQLIGAPSPQAAALMARALAGLGGVDAFVVHGSDGLDEITTTGPTIVHHVKQSQISQFQVTPADFGLPLATSEQLAGGDRTRNVAIMQAILSGVLGPARDIVLANASAALVIAGKATDWMEGITLAEESLKSGDALSKLRQLAAFSS